MADEAPGVLGDASGITYLDVPASGAALGLQPTPSDPERLASAVRAITARLSVAAAPVILVDLDADRHDAASEIEALATRLGVSVATVATAKAVIDETHPWYLGTYSGAGSSPAVRQAVESSDCLLTVGYRRVDSTSGFFTDTLPDNAIHARAYSVDLNGENFQAVTLKELLGSVSASASRPAAVPSRPAQPALENTADRTGPLTQTAYWQEIQRFVRAGDVTIAEDGTSAIGAGALNLPSGCTYITQAVWGSIGYSVGSLLGTLMAAPLRRHLLFVGDGSFQLTAQELSTILRQDLKPIIFLINNAGYTIERTILGKSAHYNDIANWAYAELPRVFRPTRRP